MKTAPVQPDLFSTGARKSDPDTSHEAANRDPVRRGTDRARVLELLHRNANGLTDFELADLMGIQQTSAGKRRGELRDRGLVHDTGTRRPSPSGSSSIVWAIAEQGVKAVSGSEAA